jgi:uncharacterized membrane protein
MGVVFNSIYARACMGAGLAVLTGFRAFLPIAFLALYSRLEFASAPVFDGTWFAFLEHIWVIGVLFALAVIEIVIDKFPALADTRDQIMRPVKIVLGGVVFAAAMAPDHWITIVVCALIGLLIAGLADHALRSIRPGPTAGSTADSGPIILLGLCTDFVVLVGTLVFVLVPLIGALLALFMFLFVYRLQQRRKRKHKGLRILKG